MERLFGRLLGDGPRAHEPRRGLRRAATIALVSLHGGSGRTTLAANLAAALGQNGRAAVAVDLDPQNALALHFGIDPGEPFGFCAPSASAQDVSLWFNRFRVSAAVMPFGLLTGPQLATLENMVARDPGWIHKRLESVIPPETELLVLDTPARASPWTRYALSIADAVLVVVGPDPASYATLPATEALLEECMPGPQARRRAQYLVNQFDARRALDRDVLASLRGMLPERVIARPVHADEVVPEALARRKFVVQEGPDSQVVAELSALAVWAEVAATEVREAVSQPPMVPATAR
jgi:cellulose synthase operon protein YhjQ